MKFYFLPILFILHSCNTKQENKSGEKAANGNGFTQSQTTVIDDLPDSLQPECFSLDTLPEPLVVNVPYSEGGSYLKSNSIGEITRINLAPPVTIMLPVLLDEKGGTILDSAGKPFFMGNGGKSNFTNFSTDEGLALDAINCSLMDKKGNLWFGTDGGGVSRYDPSAFLKAGSNVFTNFNTAQGLANNSVRSMLEDKNGNLWFGTNGGGVSCYDGKSFTTYTHANGLVNNTVMSIFEDKAGNLWFGTYDGGVSRYDGNRVEAIKRGGNVALSDRKDLKRDKSGNLLKTFTSFTTAEGLVNNNVRSIIEDKTGKIWFGTYGGGVSRYDPSISPEAGSKSFTSYTSAHGLANNNIRIILEDKNGNLWFGTDGGGISRYDGNRVESIIRGGKDSKSDQGDLKRDKNGQLVKSFITYNSSHGLAGNNIRSIHEDKAGNLWFGTDGGGVCRYGPSDSLISDSKSFTSFTTAQGLANNHVRSILEDKAGSLWFSTFGGGVSRYDGQSFTSFTTAQGLANNNVRSILEDKSGNLWLGTLGGGVSCYNSSASIITGSKSFTNYTIAQGLANNIVRCITEDKFGNLWFGTDGGGVSRYDGNRIEAIQRGEKLPFSDRKKIKKDKNGELVKSFTSYTTVQGLANNHIRCILEDKTGNLWFGTDGGGVSRYDGNRVEAILRGENSRFDNQQGIKKDKNGRMVKSITNFTSTQGLANNAVFSITEDKAGNLWFGTDGGGVSRYNPSASYKKGSKSFINFTSNQGLASNLVRCITEDKTGNLWFGTQEGLSLMRESAVNKLEDNIVMIKAGKITKKKDMNTSSVNPFITFTSKDGLPDNFVTQIIQLPNGKMAVGTNLGITLFDISDDYTKLCNIENYNSLTGYPVKDVNVGQSGMIIDKTGIIWVATGSEKTALVRFDYSALQKDKEPPTLVIQSIKVNAENICWYNLQSKGIRKNKQDSAKALLQEFLAYGKSLSSSENESMLKRFGRIRFDGITKFYPVPENLVLPYEYNHISFEFATIETSRPFLVKFQYILDGYDNDWSPVTDRNNASFGNIREGTYSFRLKARDASGVWSKPIIYNFEVLPPWYRNWLAYFIYAVFFLLALRIFSKWRERHLRAEKKKLELNVEERTEELVHKNRVVEEQNLILEEQKAFVEKEKQRSDELLLNILPEEVAEELKAKGSAEAKQFEEVTVLFTDFKDFTRLSEKMTAKELVAEINTCFMAFDKIMEKYSIEKIKTIGDSYMCAGGLPVVNNTHAMDVLNAGLEIQHYIQNRISELTDLGKESFQIRIGVHTGPVVAGIVGYKKFAYDIWGDTVNTASRMESSGEVGKINISGTTYELVKERFICTYRGKIKAKGKGEIDMYFVVGRI